MSLISSLARTASIAAVLAVCLPALTQQSPSPSYSVPAPSQGAQTASGTNSTSTSNSVTPARIQISSPASATPTELLIGPGDEGEFSVYGMAELTTHFRVEASGEVMLPLIGRFHMAGMTADAAQQELVRRYEEGGFLRDPHVNIFIREYTTQGISVIGEVNHPGIYSALNARRLYDVFLIAGGLTQRAGNKVTITHAKDLENPLVVALKNGEAANQANVEIQPGDTITIPPAGVVYVIGEVNRPGAFVLETNQSPSLLQMLALASGPTRMAVLSHARVIRQTPKGLESKNVDLAKMMKAESGDMVVEANDIVFVPASKGKAALERGSGSILNMLTSLAVYRF
jgi:polysaccharide biosynthesis/export protein